MVRDPVCGMTVTAASGFDENEILRLAAAVEPSSEHPLAAAIPIRFAACRSRRTRVTARCTRAG